MSLSDMAVEKNVTAVTQSRLYVIKYIINSPNSIKLLTKKLHWIVWTFVVRAESTYKNANVQQEKTCGKKRYFNRYQVQFGFVSFEFQNS